tara:strand:- start:2618 stop:3034 length:417 start_codon:yes stop_codon:yes gene_type:complete
MTPTVELRLARLPGFLGRIAAHYWLVDRTNPETPVRWEIWQDPDVRGESWGHLHKNLKSPADGVGNGGSWVEVTWHDRPADEILGVLRTISESYPARFRYWSWPGPNSNTFVQWVLLKAGTNHQLGPMALGATFAHML